MPIGASYAPGADIPMEGRNGNGGGASRLSPQQAVKILSLRVPEALPSNAPVSRSLLTSPGGSAAGASGLQSMIQQLMQSFKPQAGTMPTAGPMPGAPPQAPQGPSAAPSLMAPTAPPQFTDHGAFGSDGSGFDGFNVWDLLLNQDSNLDPAERQRRLDQASQFYFQTPAQPTQTAPAGSPKFIVENPIPPKGVNV